MAKIRAGRTIRYVGSKKPNGIATPFCVEKGARARTPAGRREPVLHVDAWRPRRASPSDERGRRVTGAGCIDEKASGALICQGRVRHRADGWRCMNGEG